MTAEKESITIRSELEREKLAGASIGELAAMVERMAIASSDDEALAELYEETIDKADPEQTAPGIEGNAAQE
jgi:hypothetical protein